MQRATSVVEPGMAEASAATTIYAYDGHNVYSSGGACLRHARPHRSVGCLRKMWVTGRLYTPRPSFVYSSGGACLRHAGGHGIPDLATALGSTFPPASPQ